MYSKSRIMLPLLAVGGLMAVSMPSFAQDLPHQDPGIFVGGGAIYTRLNNDFRSETFDTDDFDDDRVSWKAFAGYRFTPIFSVEGQYIDFGDAVNNSARVEADGRSEEHTSELQSLMRNSYAVFCLKKKKKRP